ncbi:M48 family metallopeptidase [Kiloniella antarctica]|uniref:M48 family metallopeptidase n=1 Tax=Kiloniella antarctica TaxID=1550907 RepID=A0ABW5BG60_9PROT
MKSQQQSHTLDIEGRKVGVIVQPHPTSRKLSLRLVPGEDAVKVVAPIGCPLSEILEFVNRQKNWVAERFNQHPIKKDYQDGDSIPILGREHIIIRINPENSPRQSKGVAWLEAEQLFIKSHPEHLPRRVKDFLKKEVRFEIDLRAQEKAALINKKITAIRIKDTTSRWGSCSTHGNLNFSWRLIFAPEQVLDYVVAHEVAHLEHMNHSAAFWAVVDELTNARKWSQNWLKINGSKLLSYC